MGDVVYCDFGVGGGSGCILQVIVGVRCIGFQGGIGVVGFSGCGQYYGVGGEGIGIVFVQGGQEDGILCS